MYGEINILYENSMKGCIESKEKLLLKLKPLILSNIMKYHKNYELYNDLLQEGYLHVLELLETYDREKQVHLLGYIKMNLRYHYLNNLKKNKNTVSLNEFIGDDLELMDILEDKEVDILNNIISKEDSLNIVSSINSLTERQKDIITMFYINELSIGDIAEKLNISYRTVVNIKKTGLDKMMKKLYKIDNGQFTINN